MKEEFLQYIWKQQLFDQQELQTEDGEELTVTHSGFWNQLSGPDFLEAQVQIGDTKWAGSVEIHTRASAWYQHSHDKDDNYKNVILHVVYDNDLEATRSPNIPVLKLRDRIDPALIEAYERLTTEKEVIPCKSHLPGIDALLWQNWKDRLLVQRLEHKNEQIDWIFQRSEKDWFQSFFVLLAGYLGQNQNKLPFQQVAFNIPVKKLLKVVDQPGAVKAMVFGVAGLLDQLAEPEQTELKDLFRFHKAKLNLETISAPWKFGKIRPEAAPKKRLELLVGIVEHISDLQASSVQSTLMDWIKNTEAILQKSSFSASRQLLELLYINAVVPYAFYFAKSTGNDALRDSALDAMNTLKAEDNRITRAWKTANVELHSANDSQALIELFTRYCDKKNCVLCNVGQQIIQSTL